ncbi:hypothetical protein, partial [Streptomyces cacaoi]
RRRTIFQAVALGIIPGATVFFAFTPFCVHRFPAVPGSLVLGLLGKAGPTPIRRVSPDVLVNCLVGKGR